MGEVLQRFASDIIKKYLKQSGDIKDIMNLSFDRGISAVNALKEEYDALCIELVKKKSREENLKHFISEKDDKIVEFKREYVLLNENLISTERQVESIEATIQHYHEIKRSLVADVQQKEENLDNMRNQLAALVEKKRKGYRRYASLPRPCHKRNLVEKSWIFRHDDFGSKKLGNRLSDRGCHQKERRNDASYR